MAIPTKLWRANNGNAPTDGFLTVPVPDADEGKKLVCFLTCRIGAGRYVGVNAPWEDKIGWPSSTAAQDARIFECTAAAGANDITVEYNAARNMSAIVIQLDAADPAASWDVIATASNANDGDGYRTGAITAQTGSPSPTGASGIAIALLVARDRQDWAANPANVMTGTEITQGYSDIYGSFQNQANAALCAVAFLEYSAPGAIPEAIWSNNVNVADTTFGGVVCYADAGVAPTGTNIKLGDVDVTEVYLGDVPITACYLGDVKIFGP